MADPAPKPARVELPRPGTQEAQTRGCTCAVIDNHHGKGRYGDGETYGWFYSGNCPLHGWQEAKHG